MRTYIKKFVIIACLLLVFGGLGTYLYIHVKAASTNLAVEAENGTLAKGATKVSDSKASGGSAVHFNVPDSGFSSNVDDSDDSVSATKGSYGSLTPITNKGYAKKTILQVADAATATTKSCAMITADKRINWTDTTCETFDSTGWRQQGIAGVGGSGYSSRHDVILVSWHSGDDQQSRLTVMNKTTKKQVFVELVRACDDSDGYCDMASPTTQCGTVHAGGLAWYKNTLFAADSGCIITYDLNNIYQNAAGNYILPATSYWKRSSGTLVFSTVGIDLSDDDVPQLLTAEYLTDCTQTRFGRWNIDPATANLQLDSGSTTRSTIDIINTAKVCYVQGIAYYAGMYFFGTSGSGTDYVYRLRDQASAPPDTSFLWPLNTPQGIYVDPTDNTTWSLTESASGTDTYCRVFGFATTSLVE